LHTHAGRRADAERLARRVIEAFPGDAPIVVDSAGCGAALTDYGHLLGTDSARAFAARVVDVSTWIASRELPELARHATTVVVQDPCHLRHVQHAHLPVAELLGRAYDVRLTADDGLCCGAGGAYAAFEPALSASVRSRKVEALVAAAGDRPFVVASANPGCALHLGAAGLTVRHPVELLDECLGPD
jgi:glycolate oxidase iron-sulfur subunit